MSATELEEHSFGMPSGHSQIASLTATFWTLYQYGKLKKEFLVHYDNIFYLNYRHKHLEKINKI